MKDQLQLQEIAGYLPYGLHIKHNEGARLIICGAFKKYNADDFFTYSLLNWEKDVKSIDAKPILRPMSDFLISDNLYDCNRIMHNEEYDKAISHVEYIIESGNYFDARLLPSCFVDLMKKEHIDFQDLIGRGLAISIHDIPTKP